MFSIFLPSFQAMCKGGVSLCHQAIGQGFDVTGYVRNLADGRVELEAEGTEGECRRFLSEIESELDSYIRKTECRTGNGLAFTRSSASSSPLMVMTPAIAIRGLTKDFRVSGSSKRLRAVDDLSLEIGRNSIYGLLGPNGSGKSTTIKIALGLVQSSVGECEIFGIPSINPAARTNVGYLPEAPYFQRFLTGRELLKYFGSLSNVPKDKIQDRIDYLLNRVGLEDAGDRRVGGYSKGMLQRIGLAQALVGDPELLVLDEPTAGVDPVGAAEIASLILELKKEGKRCFSVPTFFRRLRATATELR